MSKNAMEQLKLEANTLADTIKTSDGGLLGDIESRLYLIAAQNALDRTIGATHVKHILDCVHYSRFIFDRGDSDWQLPLQVALNTCLIASNEL